MDKDVKEGVYLKPDSYLTYKLDRYQLLLAFRETPNKGMKAQELLNSFLKKRKDEALHILHMDSLFNEEELKMHEEFEREFFEEHDNREREMARMQAEQIIKDREHSHKENIRQFTLKMEMDKEALVMEYENAMESKLREQELLLNQGCKQYADVFADEIRQLEEELNTTIGNIKPCEIS
ncbi:guanylate-binding protein 3-like [Discoglossus pictus]